MKKRRIYRSHDVLVTGATGTIGRAVALRLACAGYVVHLAGRDKKRLAALRTELQEIGAASFVHPLELSNLKSAEGAVRSFLKKSRRPYALVCATGHLGPVGEFWRLPIDRWRQSFSDNFLAQASMIHAFAQGMAARQTRQGAIVLFSGAGVGGRGDFSSVSSYSTSKAALVHLSEALAPELASLGISINAIAPGPVLSNMTRQTLQAGKRCSPAFLRAAAECRKSGGVSPDLAAQLTEFLLMPKRRLLTGRLLSARFDQTRARQATRLVVRDADAFRMRRIDNVLYKRKAL